MNATCCHWNPDKTNKQSQRSSKERMEKQHSGNPMEFLNIMVSEPYYLLHFLTFFSYFIIRTSATSVLSPHHIHHLLHRVLSLIQNFLCFFLIITCPSILLISWFFMYRKFKPFWHFLFWLLSRYFSFSST